MKEHRSHESVREMLADPNNEGPKKVAAEFLENYGAKVWKLKGKNCKQDRKYAKTLFNIKVDSEKLVILLPKFYHC